MDPNEMTDPRVIKQENREQAKAEALAKKGGYKRLMKNPDFLVFYNHLETCYNSYMEAGGDSTTPKDMKDDLLRESATLYKIMKFIDRQAS